MGRVLGVDPGQRRIGIAISDPSGTIASPHGFVDTTSGDFLEEIAGLCRSFEVTSIVVGLAISLDGTEGDAARRGRTLGEALGKRTDLPITYHDERFTTVTAEDALIEGGVRRKDRKAKRDQVAASVMLQGYLDARTYDAPPTVRRFAVVGDPVAHSRSPAIHNAAYVACGIQATYDTMRVPAGEFARVVAELTTGDLAGVNVTMPLKAEAYQAVDEHSIGATRANAVNTIVVDNGRLMGHNTDIDGVAHAIAKLAIVGRPPVLILGAGGAARAAAVAVEDHTVYVSARRTEAAHLVLEATTVSGSTVPWGESVTGAIVINATPIGMHGGSIPAEMLSEAAAVVDMAYGDEATGTIEYAVGRGIPTADGLDMLVGQAAAAFSLFVGVEPPLHAMELAARGHA
ncbi:MAG: shikimate dehydrogenase [Acidimicrobiia bacterium]